MAEPYIPPPPPYQTSQQELDQKVSHVLLASFPIPNAQPGANHTDDYQFDEVPFEAPYGAAARLRESQGASSNSRRSSDQPLGAEKRDHPASQNVQPLRIHKKKPSGSQPKERPSWYTEADLDQGPVFQPLSGPSTPYNETGRRPAELPLPQLLPDHNEDRARAPPPLHASPPFEDVVMAYHGNGSAPPSPLSAPPSPSHSPHPSRPPSRHADRTVSSRSPQPYWSHPHQSLPPPARRVPQRMSPRPTTSYVPPMNTVSQPHMTFDHNVAYTRRGDDTPVPTSEPRAVAFYNSAVSAHLPTTSSKPTPRAIQPHMRHQYQPPTGSIALPTSPTYSVTSFPPYAFRPGAAPPAQPSPPGDFQTQYLPRPGAAQPRWATSEEEIGRNY